MKKIKDERVTAKQNKIGHESFWIMVALIFINIIVTNVFGVNDIIEMPIVMLIGCVYYSIRCAFAGIFCTPISKKNKNPEMMQCIIGFICAAIGALFMTIRNTNLYLNGKFGVMSIILFFTCFVIFSILIVIPIAIGTEISKAKERRELKDDDE